MNGPANPSTQPLWSSETLRSATQGDIKADVTVTGVSIDTRTLRKGDLFVALKGAHSNGHAHIEQAFEKGAAAVMVDARFAPINARTLVVSDTLDGLRSLARAARARFRGRMISVTGSVGKTTTKDMLKDALCAAGLTHAAMASYNNHWGLPLTLARLPQDAAFCVTEIGMNHRGEIAPLASLARPNIALITSIGSSHLGTMGSVKRIAEEKAGILSALDPSGVGFVPDTPEFQTIYTKAVEDSGGQFTTIGFTTEADHRITRLCASHQGSEFWLDDERVSLKAPGAHLAQNAAFVVMTLKALSAFNESTRAALENYQPGRGRGELFRLKNDTIWLQDESYNASVLSIRAALNKLSLFPSQRRVVVLGDILELGTFAATEHMSLVPDLIAHADIVFCCHAHMLNVFNALPANKRGAWQPDAAALIPDVLANVRVGDAILVKGSNGTKMRDIVSSLLSNEA